MRTPPFFNPRLDPGLKCEDFPKGGEAERRISFFARSLSTAMPKSISVEAMPGFTILLPHYSEKVSVALYQQQMFPDAIVGSIIVEGNYS